MLDNLSKGAPSSEKGWPDLNPLQGTRCNEAMAKQTALDNKNYTKQIEANGKLLIGDYHSGLDGILTLYHMLQELPVKHLYLEGAGMSVVLGNSHFIQWLKEHPNASAQDAFARMTELCLQEEPPRMAELLYQVDEEKLTLDEATDIFRRWMEVECAVAQHVAAHDISVTDMFAYAVDPKNPTKVHTVYSDRVLVDEAYKSFVDDLKGLRVMLVGENHITNAKLGMPEEPLYGLLGKTKGVFARTTLSHVAEEANRKRTGWGLPFFNQNQPLGLWKESVQVPGAAAIKSEKSEQASASITHQTMFSLYKAPD
ncbi:MAG: hypothetical protein EOO23_06640 [Comamonadaceae bacterium]|nr:MAG: hypothetical protein EOO23_06640 [Comamonadaceae bacterium]